MSTNSTAQNATSRIARWNETKASSGMSSVSAASVVSADVERAEAAIKVAASAYTSTQAKLKRIRRIRQSSDCVQAALGTLGLGGLLLLVASSGSSSSILTGASVLLAAIPILASARRGLLPDMQELSTVSALEQARAGLTHARELRDVLRQALQNEMSNGVAKHILRAAVMQIEQNAAATPGRENRRTGDVGADSRRHGRIKPVKTGVVITRSDDVAIPAELIDVSISGAAVVGNLPKLAIGEEIIIGSREARVVREIPDGVACEFVVPLAPQELDVNIIL